MANFINYLSLICWITCKMVVYSSPFRRGQDAKQISDAAFVKCSDTHALERILVAKLPYRCLEEASVHIVAESEDTNKIDDFVKPQKVPSPSKQLQLEEVTNLEQAPCVNPLKCPLSDISAKICGRNQEFVVALGDCAPITNNNEDSVQQPDLDENTQSSTCQDGFYYDLQMGLCIPEINRDSYFYSCQPGFQYSPEKKTCLFIETFELPPKPSSSIMSSKVFYEISSNENFGVSIKSKKCTDGMVFSSEIDLCVSIVQQSVHLEDQQKNALIDSFRSKSKIAISKKSH